MDHPSSVTSSQESVFSFDPALLPAVTMSVETNTVQSQPVLGRNPSTFVPGPQSFSPLGSPDQGLMSSPFNIPRFAPPSQPSWMGRTPPLPPYASQSRQQPCDPPNMQHPSALSIAGSPAHGIFSPSSPVGAYREQFYQMQQAHMSNLQLMQCLQGEVPPNQPHPPPNMVVRHQSPAARPQSIWSPQHSPTNIQQNYCNREVDPRRPLAAHSQMFFLQQMERPRFAQFQNERRIPLSSPPTEVPQRVFRMNQPMNQSWVQPPRPNMSNVVRPIPIYSNQAPPGFEVNKTVEPATTSLLVTKTSKEPVSSSLVQIAIANHTTQKPAVLEPTTKGQTAEFQDRASKDIVVSPTTSIISKKRPTIDAEIKQQLEVEFLLNKSPSQAELSKMADKFGISKSSIRTWFSSRRQKQKKVDKQSGSAVTTSKTRKSGRLTESSKSKRKVPSQTHDITVEVPSINPRDRGSVVHQDYNKK